MFHIKNIIPVKRAGGAPARRGGARRPWRGVQALAERYPVPAGPARAGGAGERMYY